MLLLIENGDSFKMTEDLPIWVEKWLREKDNEKGFIGRTEEQAQKLAPLAFGSLTSTQN